MGSYITLTARWILQPIDHTNKYVDVTLYSEVVYWFNAEMPIERGTTVVTPSYYYYYYSYYYYHISIPNFWREI